ncbi:MAG: hypothetical protein ACYC49_09865 [Ignavibacteriaceae bacterium]
MFDNIYKTIILLMVASDNTITSSFFQSTYDDYLPNRNLPLSIILEEKGDKGIFRNIHSKLGDLLRDNMNGNYEYLQEMNNLIDNIISEISRKNHPEKYYFLKTAIIVRCYEAFKRIVPNLSLQNYRDNLIKFNNFKEDEMMSNIYNMVCNKYLERNNLERINSNQFDLNKFEDYLDMIKIEQLKGYISYFFYWFKNDRFNL